ncbi:MAG TPA: hypothetical protein PK467_04225 [Candidatus Wallbacteria bacterium]|nr:hypothetical protein [Candidatus Wallbacteria bacterium]
MNKIIISVVTAALGLLLSFGLLEVSKTSPEHFMNAGFFVSDEKIKSAFLDRGISLEDIPPGFYAWQSGTPSSALYESNSGLLSELSSEAVYKSFKFKNQNGPWIKFLISADSQIVFTSSGLISAGNSSSMDVLETISNKIKTAINESKKIKLSQSADQSSMNISAAIYNAIGDKITIGRRMDFVPQIPSDQISQSEARLLENSAVKDIFIAGKKRGIYLEAFFPGYFKRVKLGFVIKNSGHIAKIFILSDKKTVFTSGGARDEIFTEAFSQLLISDVKTDNAELFKESGARHEIYTLKYKLIKFMSGIFPPVKSYISRRWD